MCTEKHVFIKKKCEQLANYGFATTSLNWKESLWCENTLDTLVKKMFQVQQKVMLWQSSETWKNPWLLIFLKKVEL